MPDESTNIAETTNAAESTRRRFRFRFSLRAFFVMIALASVVATFWLAPTIKQRNEVELLKQWEIGVSYAAAPRWVPSWCTKGFGRDLFCRVDTVDSLPVNDAGPLASVIRLTVPDNGATRDIAKRMRHLRSVTLGKNVETNFLTDLKDLDAVWCRYGQADQLPNLPQLRTLLLDGDDQDAIDLALLSRFRNLRTLSTVNEVTNLGMINHLANLETVRIGSHENFQEIDFAVFSNLKRLKRLNVSCGSITNAARIADLVQLQSFRIRVIELDGTYQTFRDMLPDSCECEVSHGWSEKTLRDANQILNQWQNGGPARSGGLGPQTSVSNQRPLA